jgi:PTS system nitrogen regulatory IIA component
MDLYEILDKKSCSVDLNERSKPEVLRRLSLLAVESEHVNGVGADKIFEALSEREKQGSTGFGNEIAIPHARIEGMNEFLLFIATSSKGVDFEAMDKKRVKLIFTILGPPTAVNEHLKILAFVSRALGHTNVKQELLKAQTTTALYEAFIRNADVFPSDAKERRKMKLVLINLYLDEFLYSVLELLIEEGIEGATIMDSAGMGQYISNVPLFADFIGFMRQSKHTSKTIMALVPEEHVDDLIARIEEVTGDLDKKQGAVIMAVDVSVYKGTMKMM